MFEGMHGVLLFLVMLVAVVHSEEWYQPDSHLISDIEFTQHVLDDKSAFKIVKYFSPSCVYCRYLKQAVDQLKREKQWCFKFYDFNCAWYPQHCMQHVRSASFPYTAIHDQRGDLHEEIHGFYPEPVLRTIFDRIEQHCLDATKKSDGSLTQQQPATDNRSSLKAEDYNPNAASQQEKNTDASAYQQTSPTEKAQQNRLNQQENTRTHTPKQDPLVEHSQTTPQAHHQNPIPPPQKPIPAQQNKFDQPKVPSQEQKISVSPPTHQKESITPPHNNPPPVQDSQRYLKFAVYGVTVLIAALYFHKINKEKQDQDTHSNSSNSQQNSPLLKPQTPVFQSYPLNPNGVQVQVLLAAQSELSAQIPDQQL